MAKGKKESPEGSSGSSEEMFESDSSGETASPQQAGNEVTKPTYLTMILEAVLALNDRYGSSRQSIVKFIGHQYGLDMKKSTGRMNQAIKRALDMGILKHTTGSGVVGSFKIGHVGLNASAAARNIVSKLSVKNVGIKKAVELAILKKAVKKVAKGKGKDKASKKPPPKKAVKKVTKKGTAKKAAVKKQSKKAVAKAGKKQPAAQKTTKQSPAKKGAKKPIPKKVAKK
ncbi:histone H1-gamma, late-like [Penaeus japonicus]|uniref:histone H1-gamma, late-like n=1 Tax=Penaeus japonicus TaxID=27405 RepID=UPI001C70CC3F|nr:histone H1-gamma, late-like [Penaeus japonicus]